MAWLRRWKGRLAIFTLIGPIAIGSYRPQWGGPLLGLAFIVFVAVLIVRDVRKSMWHLRMARIHRRAMEEAKTPRCRSCGYDLRASKFRCPECGTPVTTIPLTPMADRSILAASAIAREMSDESVGTEHLLLALFREPEGVAAFVLDELGISESLVRECIDEAMISPISEGGAVP